MLCCRLGAAPHGGADCGGTGVCVRRGLPGRPEGQVRWVTGKAQACVARARVHLWHAPCSTAALVGQLHEIAATRWCLPPRSKARAGAHTASEARAVADRLGVLETELVEAEGGLGGR